MPRRKRPLLQKATADRDAIEALRPVIEKIVRNRNFFARLDAAAKGDLVDRLLHAVGFAKAGLADILTGKETKPVAWTMDIFVRDVCDALRDAGMQVSMNPDPEASLAQSLAREIARAVKLPGGGNLFKQMQRGKKIIKLSLPEIQMKVSVFSERQ